jgi:hypothetical protein
MGKKSTIKSTDLPINFGSDEQGSPGCPKDICHGIVLPTVLLHYIEDASATEGIAQTIDITACGTGVLEMGGGVLGTYLRLTGSDVGVVVHIGEQGLQPPLGRLDIGVEQEIVVIGLANGTKGLVIAFGKAVVMVEDDDADMRKVGVKEGERIVGRAVVGYDNISLIGRRVGEDGGHEATEHLSAVPIEDNNGCFHSAISAEPSAFH